jgi:hypothetical protein
MSHRTITRLAALLDVSVVSFPRPEEFQPDLAGPDGTRGAPYPFAGIVSQDGTGSQSNSWLALELEVNALRHRRLIRRSAGKYLQSEIDAMGKKGQAFGGQRRPLQLSHRRPRGRQQRRLRRGPRQRRSQGNPPFHHGPRRGHRRHASHPSVMGRRRLIQTIGDAGLVTAPTALSRKEH